MKRILFNALAARSPGGGVARYAAELGRRLALADGRVTVVTTTEGARLFDALPRERLAVWKLPPLPKGRLLLEEFRLPRLARAFDLLYQPDFKLPRGVRTNAIVTAHDLFFEQFPGDYGFFQRRYKAAQAAQAARAAARAGGRGPGAAGPGTRVTLVSLTKVKAREIRARYELPEAPRVIHPGVDAASIAGTDDDVDLARRRGCFVFINAAGRRKGSQLLLSALRELNAGDVSHISWIGPWNWNLTTNELVSQRIRADREVQIIPAGEVSEAALKKLLATCTALLFPSLDEGFGLPVLEAIAANCPVFASDLPVLRESFENAPHYLPRDEHQWSMAMKIASVTPPVLDPAARAAVLEKCDWKKSLAAHRALIDEMIGA